MMPWELRSLVWSRTWSSPGELLVMLILAEHADEDHSCFPSQATIASFSRQSERTVRRTLGELVARGLVVVTPRGDARGGRTSNRYVLQVAAMEALPVSAPDRRGVTGQSDQGDSGQADQGVTGHPEGGYRPNEGGLPATQVSGERIELTTTPSLRSGAPAASQRPHPVRARDVLFETVAEVCSIDWRRLTKAGRGSLNGALAQLRDVDATPDDVVARARVYSQRYGADRLTPAALAKHWAGLDPGAQPAPRPTPVRGQAVLDRIALRRAQRVGHPAGSAVETTGRPA